MVAVILLLLFLGLALIVLESLIPGGVVGALGVVCIGISAWLCASHFGWTVGGWYLIGVFLLGVTVALSAFFWAMRRLSLKPPEEIPPGGQPDLLGKTGRVVSPLRPVGAIEVDGKRQAAQAAFSGEEIASGAFVRVIGRDGVYLIVEPCEESGTG